MKKVIRSFKIGLALVLILAFAKTGLCENIEAKLSSKDGSNAFQVQNSDGATLLNVQSDGKVGIGATKPTASLQVKGDSVSLFGNDSSEKANYNNISIYNSSDWYHYIEFNSGRYSSAWRTGFHSYLSTSSALDNDDFTIGRNWSYLNTNRFLTIKPNGKVGIGTTSPSSLLSVAGDIYGDGYVKGQTGVCIGNDCKAAWPSSAGFGAWVQLSANTVYSASTDGFVLATNNCSSPRMYGITDGSSSPSVVRITSTNAPITMPVKKGDFWNIQSDWYSGGWTSCYNTNVYWIPLGN